LGKLRGVAKTNPSSSFIDGELPLSGRLKNEIKDVDGDLLTIDDANDGGGDGRCKCAGTSTTLSLLLNGAGGQFNEGRSRSLRSGVRNMIVVCLLACLGFNLVLLRNIFCGR
jgi:hypothetical protein